MSDRGILGRQGQPRKAASSPPLPQNPSFQGWLTGFEPATSGTTNRRSNRVSYSHHLAPQKYSKG
jgi:hypothetical protein